MIRWSSISLHTNFVEIRYTFELNFEKELKVVNTKTVGRSRTRGKGEEAEQGGGEGYFNAF